MDEPWSLARRIRSYGMIVGLLLVCFLVPGGLIVLLALSLFDGGKWLKRRVAHAWTYGWQPGKGQQGPRWIDTSDAECSPVKRP